MSWPPAPPLPLGPVPSRTAPRESKVREEISLTDELENPKAIGVKTLWVKERSEHNLVAVKFPVLMDRFVQIHKCVWLWHHRRD